MIYTKVNGANREVIRAYVKSSGRMKQVEAYVKVGGSLRKLIPENYLIADGNGNDMRIYFGNNFDIGSKFRFKAKFRMGSDRRIPYLEKGFSSHAASNSYFLFGGYYDDGKIQFSKHNPNSFGYIANQVLQPWQTYTRDLIINNSNATYSCTNTSFSCSYGNFNTGNRFGANGYECILNFMNKSFRLYGFTIGGNVNGVYREVEFDLAEARGARVIKSKDGSMTARLGADVHCYSE